MINRFALSFLCIELDRNEICEVTLVYILLSWTCLMSHHDNAAPGFLPEWRQYVPGAQRRGILYEGSQRAPGVRMWMHCLLNPWLLAFWLLRALRLLTLADQPTMSFAFAVGHMNYTRHGVASGSD